MQCAGEEIREHRAERDALDALAAPVRADAPRRAAPDLLRIALEERLVEPPPEPVHHEVLERLFLALVDAGGKIRRPDAAHARKTEVADGREAQGNGIVEELVQVENARDALPVEEHRVRRLRVGAVRARLSLSFKQTVIERRRRGVGQDLLPERLHLRTFREEAMAADVHAVSAEIHRAGKAADDLIRLEDDGLDV